MDPIKASPDLTAAFLRAVERVLDFPLQHSGHDIEMTKHGAIANKFGVQLDNMLPDHEGVALIPNNSSRDAKFGMLHTTRDGQAEETILTVTMEIKGESVGIPFARYSHANNETFILPTPETIKSFSALDQAAISQIITQRAAGWITALGTKDLRPYTNG